MVQSALPHADIGFSSVHLKGNLQRKKSFLITLGCYLLVILFIDLYLPLMIGVTFQYTIPLLKCMIYFYTNKFPLSKKRINVGTLLRRIQLSQKLQCKQNYANVKKQILSLPSETETFTFDESSMFEQFLSSILYYNSLTIIIKCIVLFPLLSQLHKMRKNKDIFSSAYYYLKKWITKSFCFSFNGARFDTLFIHKYLTKIVLLQKHKSVLFQKYGNSIINLSYTIPISNNQPKIKIVKSKHLQWWNLSTTTLCFKVLN